MLGRSRSPVGIQACALRDRQESNGKTFHNGADGGQVFVLPNTRKEKPEQPDARIVLAQRELRKDNGTGAVVCSTATAKVRSTNRAMTVDDARGQSTWTAGAVPAQVPLWRRCPMGGSEGPGTEFRPEV